MSIKIGALTLSAALVAPLAVSAEEFSGILTLGYSQSEYEDAPILDVDSLTIDGRVSYALGNGLSFGARYSRFDQDYKDYVYDFFGDVMEFSLSYSFTDAISAGVFVERTGIGFDLPSFTYSDALTSTARGVEAHFVAEGLDLGAFLAKGDMGGYFGSSFGYYDIKHSGLSARYSWNNLTVGGSFVRTSFEYPGGVPTYNVDASGIAAVYGVTDSFNLFGGVARFKNGLDGWVRTDTTTSIGGTYDLTAAAGMPLVASLELARQKSEMFNIGKDIDSVRLGLTIPLGKAAVQAPLNSSVDAILNPSRSAISQGLLSF